jgi:hypothetical protein
LLSICLCTACAASLAERDVDVVELSHDIRAAVDREMQHGVPAGQSLTEALGQHRAQAIYQHRKQVITELTAAAQRSSRGRKVLLMATDDPQVTGPDVGVELPAFTRPPDAFVLKCWDDEEAAISRMKSARTEAPLIANVNALGERPEDLPALAARLVAAGASELRYYHAGLASPARQAAIRQAVEQR